MGKRLWVTGYRSWELNVYGPHDPKLAVLKYMLKSHLQTFLDDGGEWVITGGEMGIEQWGASVALALKPAWPSLKVAVMVPFADFGNRWNEDNQAALATLRQQVDFSASTSSGPYKQPAQLSGYTRFMVQHTDQALIVYDPEFEGKSKFAYEAAVAEGKRRDYPIDLVTMPDLEEDARNYGEQQAARQDE
ncbi:DUF1273 domain-containing protein [Lacticaseibacillus mingshuiensis]|uniref:DUF1273 domain-containing protein n=1 Tax=Lacticaseibacillus mingshuiensis TaxID=2799574 RepID=UPI00194DEBA2|nr:DUF1273 domain-containing protein [Lacticaseibacillus mingshuiensis]